MKLFLFILCVFLSILKSFTQSNDSLSKQSTSLGFSGPLIISVEPLDQHICPNGSAIFESKYLTQYGYGQWQISTDEGVTWTSIENATSDTLIVQPVSVSMHLYKYRRYYYINTNSGASRVATLYFDCVINACSAASTKLVSDQYGSSYKWQVDTGNGFNNIVMSQNYNGIDSNVLLINNTPSTFNKNKYKCIVNDVDNGTVITLKVGSYWIGNKGVVGADPASINWENPWNWSCGEIPSSNTNVIVERGLIELNSNSTIRSLTISPDAKVKINSNSALNIVQ